MFLLIECCAHSRYVALFVFFLLIGMCLNVYQLIYSLSICKLLLYPLLFSWMCVILHTAVFPLWIRPLNNMYGRKIGSLHQYLTVFSKFRSTYCLLSMRGYISFLPLTCFVYVEIYVQYLLELWMNSSLFYIYWLIVFCCFYNFLPSNWHIFISLLSKFTFRSINGEVRRSDKKTYLFIISSFFFIKYL